MAKLTITILLLLSLATAKVIPLEEVIISGNIFYRPTKDAEYFEYFCATSKNLREIDLTHKRYEYLMKVVDRRTPKDFTIGVSSKKEVYFEYSF